MTIRALYYGNSDGQLKDSSGNGYDLIQAAGATTGLPLHPSSPTPPEGDFWLGSGFAFKANPTVNRRWFTFPAAAINTSAGGGKIAWFYRYQGLLVVANKFFFNISDNVGDSFLFRCFLDPAGQTLNVAFTDADGITPRTVTGPAMASLVDTTITHAVEVFWDGKFMNINVDFVPYVTAAFAMSISKGTQSTDIGAGSQSTNSGADSYMDCFMIADSQFDVFPPLPPVTIPAARKAPTSSLSPDFHQDAFNTALLNNQLGITGAKTTSVTPSLLTPGAVPTSLKLNVNYPNSDSLISDVNNRYKL